MANRPVTTVRNLTLPVPPDSAQLQGIVARPPLTPSHPPVPLQSQPQAPSYVEYASQYAPAVQYPPAPQPTTARQLPVPQVAQPQIGQVAPQPLPQFFGVHPASATLLLPQQLLAGQQAYVPLAPPLPANPEVIPQVPLAPAPPMEVDGHNGAQDEQGAVVIAAGGAPPGGGPNV
jgi:hypothetical protein